jgi:hypothetical protein
MLFGQFQYGFFIMLLLNFFQFEGNQLAALYFNLEL